MKRRKFIGKTALGTLASVGLPSIVPASVFGKNAPSNKINIGQIGCGRIARSHDLIDTMAYDVANVMAVCDLDFKRMEDAKELVDKFYQEKKGKIDYKGTKVYGDYREMIMDKDIDAVLISTPDHWHAQPAMEAAIAGKDIYLQKPTSLTVEEGRQLVNAVQKNKVILQVGTQQRAMPQFRIAAELVRNGRIGKLHTVKIGLPGDPGGPEAPTMPIPKNLNFDMWLGSTLKSVYRNWGSPSRGIRSTGLAQTRKLRCWNDNRLGATPLRLCRLGYEHRMVGPSSVQAIADFPNQGFGMFMGISW